MTNSSVGLARGILRNAGGLFLVGVFAKGMGLVIAIFVARFLGADAMGLFALLFSVAMLLETFISIGMSDSLVRDVAASPAQARNLYLHALKLVLANQRHTGACVGRRSLPERRSGSDASQSAGRCLGCTGLWRFVVSQAVMQGTERVLMLTWVTFLARVLSLIWLLVAFFRGAGVEAAFVSRVHVPSGIRGCFFLGLSGAAWRASPPTSLCVTCSPGRCRLR